MDAPSIAESLEPKKQSPVLKIGTLPNANKLAYRAWEPLGATRHAITNFNMVAKASGPESCAQRRPYRNWHNCLRCNNPLARKRPTGRTPLPQANAQENIKKDGISGGRFRVLMESK